MSSLSKKETQEFLENVKQISDERVTYFYLMLGSALAAASSKPLALMAPSNAHLQLMRGTAKRANS